MIKNIIHKIFSFSVVAALLLPIGIQFIHSFNEHEHIVCNSKFNQHIHQQELDCSFFHVQHSTSYIFETFNFKLKDPSFIDQKPFCSISNNHQTCLHYKSSRAPPFFIV